MSASSDVINQSKNEVFIPKKNQKMTKKDVSPVCHDAVGETKIHWMNLANGRRETMGTELWKEIKWSSCAA